MTLQFLSSKRIQGDENDTAPTDVPDGTIYYEIATTGEITKFVLIAGVYQELASG